MFKIDQSKQKQNPIKKVYIIDKKGCLQLDTDRFGELTTGLRIIEIMYLIIVVIYIT